MKIINKGNGAGGAKTNHNGIKFQDKTDNENILLENGYTKKYIKDTKKQYYLSKEYDDKTITFFKQNNVVKYMKIKYNIVLFNNPDEAYLIEYKNGRKVLKVLEKKNQNVEGSVEEKLLSGSNFKRCYEKSLGIKFEVVYGYCVSKFLQNKLTSDTIKYKIWNEIFMEDNIKVLFGDDENYFETLDKWIYA